MPNVDSPVIRRLTPADLPAVADLIDATGLFPFALLVDMVRPYFAQADGAAQGDEHWVVLDHGGPTAVAYWAPERMTQGTWNLLLIAVHPQQQGQGVGRTLLVHIEHSLAAAAQRVLLVETSGLPEFEPTRRFYLGNGYEQEACIRDYYDAGEDKIVFRKLLNRPHRRVA
jgi:ribosomal protein S18 acetylase RimI-like enzyme